MRRALEIAADNVRAGGGGPFGCVIVLDGKVLAEGANFVTARNDPTAHAEIVAIREACRRLGRFDLRDCDLYASCEPCPMCLGAIYWARLARVFYSAVRADAAAAGFDDSVIYDQIATAIGFREIPMNRLLGEEGGLPFREWKDSPDKVPY
jgi:guanine deaminase